MNGFNVLLKKEWRENTRNFKLLMDTARLHHIWYYRARNESLSSGNHEKRWEYAGRSKFSMA